MAQGTATYDPATDAGYVRLLITDTNVGGAKPPIFDDDEIAAFLDREGSTLLAAAAAVDTIAASEVLIQKRITLLDLQTDGPAEAKELRALADSLRARGTDALGPVVFDGEDEAGFGIAEMVSGPFQRREFLDNEIARG